MKHNVRSIRLLIIRLLMAFMLAATVALFSVAPTSGQTSDAESGESVRVMARLAEDGRVEFGLRTSTGNQFPSGRFFPTTITHEGWLVSTPLTLADDTQVRIIARRDGETRLEFGVRIDDPRQDFLPRARFFPRSVAVGRWLVSTPVVLPAPEVPAGESPAETDPDEPPEPPEPEDEPGDSESEASEPTPSVETISGGHRDGLIVNRGVLGNPDAPVLIVEYSDPF